jgi:hypothetical protein
MIMPVNMMPGHRDLPGATGNLIMILNRDRVGHRRGRGGVPIAGVLSESAQAPGGGRRGSRAKPANLKRPLAQCHCAT